MNEIKRWYDALKRIRDLKEEFKRMFPGKEVGDYFFWWCEENGVNPKRVSSTDYVKLFRQSLLELAENNWKIKKEIK